MTCVRRSVRCHTILLVVLAWGVGVQAVRAKEERQTQDTEDQHFYGLLVDPAAVHVDTPTSVRLQIEPNPRAPRTAHLGMERLSLTSGPPQRLGVMNDEGRDGDLYAGDGIYSLQVTFKEHEVGRVPLRVVWQQESGPVYSKNTGFLEVSPTRFPLTPAESDMTKAVKDPDSDGKLIYDEVTLFFKDGTSYDRIEAIIHDVKGVIIGRLPELGAWQIRLPWSTGAKDVKETIRRLKTYSEVEEAEPNSVASLIQ